MFFNSCYLYLCYLLFCSNTQCTFLSLVVCSSLSLSPNHSNREKSNGYRYLRLSYISASIGNEEMLQLSIENREWTSLQCLSSFFRYGEWSFIDTDQAISTNRCFGFRCRVNRSFYDVSWILLFNEKMIRPSIRLRKKSESSFLFLSLHLYWSIVFLLQAFRCYQ